MKLNFAHCLLTCAHFINLDFLNYCLKYFVFFWYKKCFRPEIFCHYFNSKECFPLTLLHINTNPHAHTLNFLSVRLFLCHTARNGRGRTMSKQLSNWMLLGNSPSSLYNDWPLTRQEEGYTHTLTNSSKISIRNHQDSSYDHLHLSTLSHPIHSKCSLSSRLFTTNQC